MWDNILYCVCWVATEGFWTEKWQKLFNIKKKNKKQQPKKHLLRLYGGLNGEIQSGDKEGQLEDDYYHLGDL